MRHVILTCKNHPKQRWMCKEIAFTPGYGYNNARRIFFNGTIPEGGSEPEWGVMQSNGTFVDECKCPPTDLILAPEEVEHQKTDPTYDTPCTREGCNVLRRVNGGHLCEDCGLSV